MIHYFVKWRNNTAKKKYWAVVQNLKSGYFHLTLLLQSLTIMDTKWWSQGLLMRVDFTRNSHSQAPYLLKNYLFRVLSVYLL